MSRRRRMEEFLSRSSKKARIDPSTTNEFHFVSRYIPIHTLTCGIEMEQGIVCSWNTPEHTDGSDYWPINFSWNFDWDQLKSQGIERISGHLAVQLMENFGDPVYRRRIDIDWKEGEETVARVERRSKWMMFEYHLTLVYKTVSYDEMFAASDKTDAILLVDGKKLHVNKAFLSFHSDFFTALFFSRFDDGKLPEIPIEDVSYEDFGLLMSMIYPKQEFPKDESVEKLLELADRFLLPAVTRQVEHHLSAESKLKTARVFWLAERYKMPKLLEKTIQSWDTVEEIQRLKKCPEYERISNETKMALFDRIMQLE